jgi:SOS response regulatory protein OraA/RecX
VVQRVDRDVEKALNRALAARRRRERTAAELHGWLRERGSTEGVADEGVAELVEIGELDDERFAFAYAADKRELAGWGRHRIVVALGERGIGGALAERAASEPRDDELGRAVELVRRKGENLEDDRGCARALAHLARRGYEHELAYEAVRRAREVDSEAA